MPNLVIGLVDCVKYIPHFTVHFTFANGVSGSFKNDHIFTVGKMNRDVGVL